MNKPVGQQSLVTSGELHPVGYDVNYDLVNIVSNLDPSTIQIITSFIIIYLV